jgi:hypothetical protein
MQISKSTSKVPTLLKNASSILIPNFFPVEMGDLGKMQTIYLCQFGGFDNAPPENGSISNQSAKISGCIRGCCSFTWIVYMQLGSRMRRRQ